MAAGCLLRVAAQLFLAVAEDAERMSDETLAREIAQIKERSTLGGQSLSEYTKFMTDVRDKAPQRLLVFFVGLSLQSTS